MTIASGQAATAADVLGKFVSKTGDVMGGSLTLASDPVLPLQAATMQYVDVVSVVAGVAKTTADAAATTANTAHTTATTAQTTASAANAAAQTALQAVSDVPSKDYVDTKVAVAGGNATATVVIGSDDAVSRSLSNWFKGVFTPAGYAGVVFDGTTDCGVALNAYLQTTPNGATIYLPGSIYTTVPILVNGARTLRSAGSLTSGIPGGSSTVQIIGSASVDPVVKCDDSGSGLSDIFVTRNGTPEAGTRGVLVAAHTDHMLRKVYSYNHDIGIQVGQTAALGGGPLNTKLDHCQTWGCTTDQVYLINCPETAFYHHRFGANGFTEPSFQSSVHIDGDNNTTTGAGTANTINFTRCQFNAGSASGVNCVLFTNYASPDGGITFTNCYTDCSVSGGFIKVDASCNVVRRVTVSGCSIFEGAAGAIVDTGKKLTSLLLSTNIFGVDLSLSGITAIIVGNVWNGGVTVTLDAMGGTFSGNTVATLVTSGAMTGLNLGANSITTFTNSSTGLIGFLPNGVVVPASGTISGPWTGGTATIAFVNSSSGAVHMGANSPVIVFDCPVANFAPDADSTRDIGTAAKRYNHIYTHFIVPTAVNVAATGLITGDWASGTTTIASVSNSSGAVHLGTGSSLGVVTDSGHGFWGHTPPVSQPAAPVTLADVISIIRGCGLSA